MKQKRPRRSHSRGSQLISIVSVSLVLVILGVVALTAVCMHNVGRQIRSGVGMVVIVDELASDGAVDTLAGTLKTAPYVSAATFATAEEVNKRWAEQLGDDELLEINPFQPEYEVSISSAYTSSDSIEAIAARLSSMPAVYDVKVHAEMVRNVNTTLNSMLIVLLAVAGAMLLISLVLINNTVRMEIYAKRTVLNTLLYVGATRGFIRRPYVVRGICEGALAGLVASAMLGGFRVWIQDAYTPLADTLPWEACALTGVALILTGSVLCGCAAWLAATRYLRGSYDRMFEL